MKNESKFKRFMSSPVAWPGGKHQLAPRLIPKFPKEYGCYAEVCGGGGSLLFAQEPNPNITEIYNDIDEGIVELFRVFKEQPEEFLASMAYELISRKNFDLYLKKLKNPELLSPVERAKMYYLIIKLSFAAKKKNFGIVTTDPLFDLSKVRDTVEKAHNRLSRVSIECLDFRILIKKYDRVHVFFYVDPPYYDTDCSGYVASMGEKDYIDLYHLLRNIKGRFMMSSSDCEFIQKLFKEFRIEEVKTVYSNQARKRKKVQELIIMNY